MDNEVLIHVRVKNDGKIGFENFAKDADMNARKISTSFADKFTESIRIKVSEQMPKAFQGAGPGSPESMGKDWVDRFGQKIRAEEMKFFQDANGRWRNDFGWFAGGGSNGGSGGRGGQGGKGGDAKVDVNVDKQSLASRFFGAGKDSADSFQSGFQSAFSSASSGDFITLFLKWIGIGGLAAAAAPVIASALTTAVGLALGGGAIGLGVLGALNLQSKGKNKGKSANTEIAADIADIKKSMKDAFTGYGEHFILPIMHFFDGLRDVGKQIEPMITHLGQVFGPVADALGKGFIGFLQNALPGIMRATEASAPIIKTLADELPALGDAFGRLFDHFRKGMPQANVFFKDLLNVLPKIIDWTGFAIEVFTRMYTVIRYLFLTLVNIVVSGALDMLNGFRAAFGWIPGIGPKLDSAARRVSKFKDQVNHQLNGINDVDITVRIHAVGLAVAQTIRDLARQGRIATGHAHGGIVGAAASGGMRSGLTMVGEHGPELAELPPGTNVRSNPDTMRMLAAAGAGSSGQPLIVQLVIDGKVLAQQLVEPTRDLIRSRGRGNVQNFLGVPGAA